MTQQPPHLNTKEQLDTKIKYLYFLRGIYLDECIDSSMRYFTAATVSRARPAQEMLQTRPRIPWCAGPWTIKSAAGWPGAETFGRMPASSNAAEIDKSALSNDIENVPQEIYDKGVSKQRTGA
eukprot:scaffold16965_cov14-Tisochrysis_lutea.AAC.1